MRFSEVQLRACPDALGAQRDFYADALGLPDGGRAVGETTLTFTAGPGEPFYHFALLVPGDRFAAAHAWISERVTLLPHRDSPDVVFDFPDWDARACYFHDPAGNIVELIAHRGLGENGRDDAFGAGEVLGLSELGLVGRPTDLAPALDALGVAVWDGVVADERALAFAGEKGRTLILVPDGRGWLPTGQPARRHPIRATLRGVRGVAGESGAGRATLADGLYRLETRHD